MLPAALVEHVATFFHHLDAEMADDLRNLNLAGLGRKSGEFLQVDIQRTLFHNKLKLDTKPYGFVISIKKPNGFANYIWR